MATILTSNLSMFRGDSATWLFAVSENDTPLNITGALFWFTAKYNVCDADPAAAFMKTIGDGITITDALNGQGNIKLDPEDTASFPCQRVVLTFDLQMKDLYGNVFTLAYGKITVNPDITITTV